MRKTIKVLKRSGARYYVQIKKGPLVNHQRPAVDVLFHSVATYAGDNAIGAILTGMGSDGVNGLGTIKRLGGKTIAEAEETCILFAMPKFAAEKGYADNVLPNFKIAEMIHNLNYVP